MSAWKTVVCPGANKLVREAVRWNGRKNERHGDETHGPCSFCGFSILLSPSGFAVHHRIEIRERSPEEAYSDFAKSITGRDLQSPAPLA